MRGVKEIMEENTNITNETNNEIGGQNNPTNPTQTNEGLESYFEKLSENLGKQMERYFTSNSKKEANNFGLTNEEMQEAANAYLNSKKSHEQTLKDENTTLKNQIKAMKSDNALNGLLTKLEVNTELKDDLMKMVNLESYYDDKNELKVEELEKEISGIVTRIPGFKKVKEVSGINFGTTQESNKDRVKAKSLEELARDYMGLNKK
jgi:hypothetical protein